MPCFIVLKCQIYPLMGNYKKAVTPIKAHYVPLAVLAQYTPPADTEWSTTVLQKTTNSVRQTAQHWAIVFFVFTHRKHSVLKYLRKATSGTHIPAVLSAETSRRRNYWKHLPLLTSFVATLTAQNPTLAWFTNYRQLVVIETKTQPLNPVSHWQIASLQAIS